MGAPSPTQIFNTVIGGSIGMPVVTASITVLPNDGTFNSQMTLRFFVKPGS
jgi:uncharacterized membrane protein YdcZ (DUF606 family)